MGRTELTELRMAYLGFPQEGQHCCGGPSLVKQRRGHESSRMLLPAGLPNAPPQLTPLAGLFFRSHTTGIGQTGFS